MCGVSDSMFHAFTDIPKHSDLRPLVQVNECTGENIWTIGTNKPVFLKMNILFSFDNWFFVEVYNAMIIWSPRSNSKGRLVANHRPVIWLIFGFYVQSGSVLVLGIQPQVLSESDYKQAPLSCWWSCSGQSEPSKDVNEIRVTYK